MRVLRLGVLALLTIAVVAAAIVLSGAPNRGGQAPVGQAGSTPHREYTTADYVATDEARISPLLSGSGTLHIEGVQITRDDQGNEVNRTPFAFWHDPRTGNARYETKTATGSTLEGFTRNGSVYSRYDAVANTATSSSVDTGSQVTTPKPVELLFRDKLALDAGRVVPVREETIDGRTAVVTAPANAPDAPDHIYIDKANGLTLKAVGISYDYTLIERVPSSQAPPGAFSVPSGVRVNRPLDETGGAGASPGRTPTADPNTQQSAPSGSDAEPAMTPTAGPGTEQP